MERRAVIQFHRDLNQFVVLVFGGAVGGTHLATRYARHEQDITKILRAWQVGDDVVRLQPCG